MNNHSRINKKSRQTLSSRKSSRSKKHSRASSRASNYDDDKSSVDSEIGLVYVKGQKVSDKDAETLFERVKVQKSKIKHLSKTLVSLQDELKTEKQKSSLMLKN